MLIGQAIENKNTDKIEIEIFLSHLLKKDRSFIQAFHDKKLNKTHTTRLKNFLERRSKNEPLPYILGYHEFAGLKFFVDSRVLIPRPETESLVTRVLTHVYSVPNRSRKNHWKHDTLTIVDVGTGSGNIAISLAKSIPFSRIIALDIDKDALAVAKKNIAFHKVGHKIKLLHSDLMEKVDQKADIIVANLPYIPRSRFKKLQKEVVDWEPTIALDGGKDGLEHYRKLFNQIPSKLKQNGLFLYELDGEIISNK